MAAAVAWTVSPAGFASCTARHRSVHRPAASASDTMAPAAHRTISTSAQSRGAAATAVDRPDAALASATAIEALTGAGGGAGSKGRSIGAIQTTPTMNFAATIHHSAVRAVGPRRGTRRTRIQTTAAKSAPSSTARVSRSRISVPSSGLRPAWRRSFRARDVPCPRDRPTLTGRQGTGRPILRGGVRRTAALLP